MPSPYSRPRSTSLRSSLGFRLWLFTLCCSGACAFPDYGFAPSAGDAASCANRLRDHDESDIDCGGRACALCVTGQNCVVPKDCASGVCQQGLCAAPTCDDGVKNGRESAVDCGESCSSKPCPTDESCRHDEDCQSLACDDDRCAEATCDDGRKNQDETDEDCGGTKCDQCDDTRACSKASDCKSGICREQRCVQASCNDAQVSPGETDKDCGGKACGPCADTLLCATDTDCISNSCVDKHCAPATCLDGHINQDETDMDCGGMHCGGCVTDQACVAHSDCRSFVCQQKKCAAPSCDDFTLNGKESGVDCGGGCPQSCAVGITCGTGADCASGVCTNSVCQAPGCDDNVKNGSESDRDCGTGCKPCAANRSCLSNDDCASKACADTCTSPLHVDLVCNERGSTATELRPYFRIVNNGKQPFPLSSLSLRYYYTKDQPGTEMYNCYTVVGGDCSLLGPAVFGEPSPKTSTADRYLELHYTAKAAALGVNQSSEIQGAFSISDYPALTQTNDYSFSTATTFQTTPLVTLYADGVLIWGTEPKL